jgi:IS30 family transposase
MSISLEEALGLPTKTQQTATLTPKKVYIQQENAEMIDLIRQGLDITEIAKRLNVDRSTLYRRFDEWVKTEQASYLVYEWHQQYEFIKQDPETKTKAFEALTKLVMKILEKQAKVEVTVNNQTNITSQVNELIKISRATECNNSTSQPSDTH